MIDLGDRLTWIQIYCSELTHRGYDPTQRLVGWAYYALDRDGWDRAAVDRLVSDRPVERQWWLLRQLLSDGAIASLEQKLREEVASSQPPPPTVEPLPGGNGQDPSRVQLPLPF